MRRWLGGTSAEELAIGRPRSSLCSVSRVFAAPEAGPAAMASAACYGKLVPQATVMIFFVPRGVRLPFHDHPYQHVVGRVLYGTLEASPRWKTPFAFGDGHEWFGSLRKEPAPARAPMR